MDINRVKHYINRFRVITRRLINHGQTDTKGSLNVPQNLKGRFCANPFKQFDVYEGGKAYVCCADWLPKSIGNLKNTSLDELWNSPSSQLIRESIHDGSFRYCDHKTCPMIQDKSLPTCEEAKTDPQFKEIIEQKITIVDELPTFINLCNDASCNLYCPSCRIGRLNYPKGKEYEKRQHIQDIITEEMFSEPTDRHFVVNVTGSGDPFASAVFRNFLFSLNGEDFPNLQINLQTNGVLFTPRNWERLHKIHKNISTVLVSFDAGTEETYNITRRGGNWDWLLENTRRLGELIKERKLNYLRLDFVVQKDNYREMDKFIEIGKSLNVSQVTFTLVRDWGTWSQKEYSDKCIWKQDHPEFKDFIKVLENPVFDDPIVALGNLTEYRARALAL